MSSRRSFRRVVGGGLIELAAVGLLVALVSSGRLHRGATESAELPESAPIVEVRHPWTTRGEEVPEEEPATLWSSIRQWRQGNAAGPEYSDEHSAPRERDRHGAEPLRDEEFVEHQLVTASEGLQKWLRERADEALRSLWETQRVP